MVREIKKLINLVQIEGKNEKKGRNKYTACSNKTSFYI